MAIDSPIPTWVKRWLGICTFVLIYDGCFCTLRPHTFPDGCLSVFFIGHGYYMKVDKHYADVKDTFVLVQGISTHYIDVSKIDENRYKQALASLSCFGAYRLNFVEASINVAVLLQLFSNLRWGKLMTIVSSVMTAWKTTMFILASYDLADDSRHVDDWFSNITQILLPSLIFVLVPMYASWTLMKDFAGVSKKSKEKKDQANHDETDSGDAVRRYNLRNR